MGKVTLNVTITAEVSDEYNGRPWDVSSVRDILRGVYERDIDDFEVLSGDDDIPAEIMTVDIETDEGVTTWAI